MQIASTGRHSLERPQETRPSSRFQDRLIIALFLLPSISLFLVFVVYPIFQSIYYSLFNWKGLGPAVDFIALDNYKRILTDRVFMLALRNNVIIVALSLLLQLPLSLVLAVMVGRDLPGRAFFRSIFFMPYVFSEVIVAIMWLLPSIPTRSRLHQCSSGPPPRSRAARLARRSKYRLMCIFVVLSWKYFGFHMLLYLTGLQNIPSEVEEAARIDGANRYQLLTQITIPCSAAPFVPRSICPS